MDKSIDVQLALAWTAGTVQMLPPDGSVAVPLHSAVQLQRGGSLVGDATQIRAALSHGGNAVASAQTQVLIGPCNRT